MILVIRQAFICLCPRHSGQTLRNRIHRLAVLQQPDNVVHANTGIFNARMTAANSRRSGDVSVSLSERCHGKNITVPTHRRKPNTARFKAPNASSPNQQIRLILDYLRLAALRGALAFVLVQFLLAQAQILRRRLHILVWPDVFQRAFQRHLQRRGERDALAVAL